MHPTYFCRWIVAAMCVLLTGCTVCQNAWRTMRGEPAQYSWKHDRQRSQELYRHWAELAWQEHRAASPDFKARPDYGIGFRDGFADFVYAGGTGEPPPVPPRRYWNADLRSEQGRQGANEWFAGYRHGAQVARDGGYRATATIESSVVAQASYAEPSSALPLLPGDGPMRQWDHEELPPLPGAARPIYPKGIHPEELWLPEDMPLDGERGASSTIDRSPTLEMATRRLGSRPLTASRSGATRRPVAPSEAANPAAHEAPLPKQSNSEIKSSGPHLGASHDLQPLSAPSANAARRDPLHVTAAQLPAPLPSPPRRGAIDPQVRQAAASVPQAVAGQINVDFPGQVLRPLQPSGPVATSMRVMDVAADGRPVPASAPLDANTSAQGPSGQRPVPQALAAPPADTPLRITVPATSPKQLRSTIALSAADAGDVVVTDTPSPAGSSRESAALPGSAPPRPTNAGPTPPVRSTPARPAVHSPSGARGAPIFAR